jgi:flagellar motility protein MotE (MotC chaperone)
LRISSLLVLAALFFASFVARAAAIATDVADKGAPPRAAAAQAPPASANCVEAAFGASLLQSAQVLRAKEAMLAERETTLNAAAAQIERRLGELDAARAEFTSAAQKVADARGAELGKVAAVYSNMKSTQAAAIIDGMDSRFAAGLLAEMSGESAAAIVAAMDPKKAYAVTVLMANRAALEKGR